MSDLIFPCPKCKTHISVDESQMDAIINCPHCNTANIVVPRPSLHFSCQSCRLELCSPKFMTGTIVSCPSCQQEISLKSQMINTTQYGSRHCVGCSRPIDSDAVFCVNCGINQNTGKKLSTQLKLREVAPQSPPQEINPILARYQKPTKAPHALLNVAIHVLKILSLIIITTVAGLMIFVNWPDLSRIGKAAYNKWTQRNAPASSPLAIEVPTKPDTNRISSTTDQKMLTTNAMSAITWGITKETLKSILAGQDKQLQSETPKVVIYNKTVVCERNCSTAYLFNSNELTGVDIAFALPGRRDLIYFSDVKDYLPEYERIRGLLKLKYGNYVEESEDIDTGFALKAWEVKVKKQRENVAFENKTLAELNVKLNNEHALERAKDYDWGHRYNKLEWQRYGSVEGYQRKWQEFDDAQRKTRERRQEYVDDENEKLTKLLNNRPSSGWSYFLSRYKANDCVIFLKCAKSETGVRIVLSYRAIDSRSAKAPLNDV